MHAMVITMMMDCHMMQGMYVCPKCAAFNSRLGGEGNWTVLLTGTIILSRDHLNCQLLRYVCKW